MGKERRKIGKQIHISHSTILWLSEIEQKKISLLTYNGVRIAVNSDTFDNLIKESLQGKAMNSLA
jgi:hypothetical protein